MTNDFQIYTCVNGDDATAVPADPAADPDAADAKFFLDGVLPAFDFWDALCEEAGPGSIERFFRMRLALLAEFLPFHLTGADTRVFIPLRLLCAQKEAELLGHWCLAGAVPLEEKRALVRTQDEILTRTTCVEHAVSWSMGKNCLIVDPKLAVKFADDFDWALMKTKEFIDLFTPWAIWISVNDFPPVPRLESWHAPFAQDIESGRGRRAGWIVTLDWFHGEYRLSAVRVKGDFDPDGAAVVSLPLVKGRELGDSVDRHWFGARNRWAERKRLELELKGVNPAAFDDWVLSGPAREECEAFCGRENRLLAELAREVLPILTAALTQKVFMRSYVWNPDTGEFPSVETGFPARPEVPDVETMRALAEDPGFRVHLLGDVRVPGEEGVVN